MSTSPVNPFSPTSAVPYSHADDSTEMRGFTKAILIVFLVFGILGIFGSLAGIVQLAISVIGAASLEGQTPDPNVPNVNLNVFPGAVAVQIAMQIFGLILSVAMVVAGSIGLKQKMLGLNLLRWTAIGLVVFKICEQVLAVVVSFGVYDQVKKQTLDKLTQNPNPPPFDVGALMNVFLYVALGFGILWAVGLIIFYVIAYLHAGNPEVRAKFQ